MSSARRSFGALVVLAAAVSACEDPIATPAVGSVIVEFDLVELEVGGTAQGTALVLSPTGSTMPGHPVTWRSTAPHVATVSGTGLVNALSAGTTGIVASSGGRADTLALTVRAGECTAAHATGSIALGQSQSGTLAIDDCTFFDEYHADGRRLTLAAAGGVQVVVSSGQFDVVAVMTDLQMNILWVAVGDGGSAHLAVNAPAGNYIVWASSYEPGETGSYTIATQAVQMASCDEPVGSVAIGQTVAGQLAATDCWMDGWFADRWSLTLASSATVQIDLTSTTLDSFLLLADQDGVAFAADDDSGGELNSRLIWTLDPGTYVIWATSYGPGETGAYQLSVQHGTATAATDLPEATLPREKALRGDASPGPWPGQGQ